MPIKRRIDKARRDLDEEDYSDHFYGPGTALIMGCGYCYQVAGTPLIEELTDQQRQAVHTAMHADWQRYGHDILAAWARRTEHDLYCSRQFHGDPDQPWSLAHFGTPAPFGE